MRFFPWTYADEDPSHALIDALPDSILRKSYLLNEGEPCAAWFPPDATLDISDDYGVKLPDAIPNTLLIHIVSPELGRILEERSGAAIELLPVRVRDKKRRPVKRRYHIVNVLGKIACLDKARSDLDMSHIVKDQVARFRRLALDADRIGPHVRLFRLAEMLELVLVREDLMAEIQAAGCTGMTFQPIEEYGAEYRALSEDDEGGA